MINEVISNHLPAHWEKVEYNRRYETFELSRQDHEFRTVSSKFEDMQIETIFRLQNPYLYGRYKLRQEHLRAKGEQVYEGDMYHAIGKQDYKIVAEYNCDYRRYTKPCHGQDDNKKAKFYSKPNEALNKTGQTQQNMAIVVAKVLTQSNSYLPSTIVKDWDTDYYPQYIVNLA